MRNSSMWPLKGSAMPLTCRPMPRGRVEIDGQRIAHLRDPGAVQMETLVVGARILVLGADDAAPGNCASMTPVGFRCPRKENAWEVQPDDRDLGR
jgi:hypothetical protein